MEHETTLRLGVFLGLFALLALAEVLIPRRARAQGRAGRWVTNWGIILASTATLRLLALALPLLAVGAAMDAASNGWGLFNLLDWPAWVEITLAVLIFDLAIWAQHLVTHKVPLLWRLHRVHHADVDMDVTTAIRFHPLEIALFNHSNMALPAWLDRPLRRVLVTPDMHRVHHSTDRAEHDSNYGFSLSLWDRLFGTYIAQPRDGHDAMQTGLEWRDDRPSRFGWSLALPFLRK